MLDKIKTDETKLLEQTVALTLYFNSNEKWFEYEDRILVFSEDFLGL